MIAKKGEQTGKSMQYTAAGSICLRQPDDHKTCFGKRLKQVL